MEQEAEMAHEHPRQDRAQVHDVEEARHRFAEELRYTARIRSPYVVAAFATVPREHFLGPGPWRVLSPMNTAEYWTTEDAQPHHLYHDILIAIDPARRLNNGQPSLWACLYDQLELEPGAHIVHVGAGTGYYSAILAEIVGRNGKVAAVEIDPELAAAAQRNLAFAWPQAVVMATNGFALRPEEPADAIIVNAGVTHLSLAWVDSLAENGRLLVPLTTGDGMGAFLLITRHGGETRHYPARFAHWTGIIPCTGGRDPAAEARLRTALARSHFAAIRSLRRAPDQPDETCWLAGEGWWLSTAPVAGDASSKPSVNRRKERAMPANNRTRPTASVLPTTSPLLAPPLPVAPLVPPVHAVDLMTSAGSAVFGAQWRAMEAKIVECPALTDSMPEFKTTYDIEPYAGESGFDDSAWPVIPATELGARRGGGMVSFFWYRTKLTMPADAQGFDTAGAMAVLRVNVDDYAEVWVNGEMPRAAGRTSPGTIQGFNIPNRLVLSRTVAPGDQFELAVFAINGPISAAPANFLWFREAKIEFFR
jgi:protein-L-isoaspartate(D-aspartate) O-methyltransferase